ncbi:MAG: fibronectin type III domain-containing protein [Ignavibacteriales bacterium]|nr:fibronectin type III domain-containing protein [Ignavibacteriales bacterium]
MAVQQTKYKLHGISYIIIIALSLIFQQCNDSTSPNELNLSAPSNLQMEILNTGSVKVSWRVNSNGAQGIQIERKLGENGIFKALASVDNSRNFYIDSTSKSTDSVYYYRLRAFYNYQFGDYSAEISLNLTFAPPASLTFVSEDIYSVKLSWNDTVSNEQGFQIERKAPNGEFLSVGRVIKNSSSFADSSVLSGDTKYTYRVRSFGPGIRIAPTNEIEVTPVFARPTGLTITFVEDSLAILNWTANNPLRKGFKIDYIDTVKTYSKGDSVISSAVTHSQKAAFKLNVPYKFRVYNVAGNRISLPSDSATSTIIFKKPSGVLITNTEEGKITFTWSDNSDFEKGFEVERRETAGGTFTKLNLTIAPNAVSASDVSVIKTNVQYYYRLRAVTKKNNYSAYSDTASVIIPFQAPTALGFTEVSSSSIKLTWYDNSSIEDSFRIERTNLVTNKDTVFNVPSNRNDFTINNMDKTGQFLFKIRAITPKKNLTAYANDLRIAYTATSIVEQKRVSDTMEVTSVALDTAGQNLFVAGGNGVIKVLNVNSGSTIRTIISDSSAKINSMAVSPNNNYIIAGYDNGRVVVWDINTGAKIASRVFSNACLSIAWSQKTNQVAAGFSDGKSYIIDPVPGTLVIKKSLTPDHLAAVYSIKFGVSDSVVVTASSDSSLKVFKVLTGGLEAALPNSPVSPVLSADILPGSSRRLVYFDKLGNVKSRIGTATGASYSAATVITTHPLGNGHVLGLDYTSFISVGSDNLLKLVRYPSIGVVNTITPHSSIVISVAVSANKQFISLAAKDKSCSVWKVESRWEKL